MGAIKKYKLKRVISGGGNNTTKYWGVFNYQKKDGLMEQIVLTNDFKVIKGEVPKDVKPLLITFSNPHFEYEINVDSDNKAQQFFLEAMRLDDKVHSTGKLKTGHLWQLVDENYEAIQTALEIKKRANVTSLIYKLSAERLSKLCYRLNVNISNKKKEEIYGLLLHPLSGKVFSKDLRGDDNYVDLILNGEFGSDFDVKSDVNKAVILGIIKQTNGTYFLGNTIVGTTIDNVYAFMKENPQVYSTSLLNELETKDNLPESIDFDNELGMVEEAIKSENANTPFLDENGKLTDEKRAELIKRADELSGLGFRIQGNIKSFSDKVLVDKVMRAEGLLANKQNL